MKPEAGVFTMHHVKNHGPVLRAYATQKILQDPGTTPFFVDFWRHDLRHRPADIADHSRWGDNPITRAAYWAVRGSAHESRRQIFNAFLDECLDLSPHSYSHLAELNPDPSEADIYCAGNDQTRNADHKGISNDTYFSLAMERQKAACFLRSAIYDVDAKEQP